MKWAMKIEKKNFSGRESNCSLTGKNCNIGQAASHLWFFFIFLFMITRAYKD